MADDVIELMPRQRLANHHLDTPVTAPHVLIADTDPLVCRVVAEAVARCSQVCVSGQATVAADLVGLAARSRVIIVDPFSFQADALVLVERLSARGSMVVVLTHWQPSRDLVACLRAGARGVLCKTGDLSSLPQALLAVLAGHLVIDSSVGDELGRSRAALSTCDVPGQLTCLTPTERAVFDFLEAGATTEAMTKQLRMTSPTLRSHISHVLRKLGLENRAQAVAFGQAMRRSASSG